MPISMVPVLVVMMTSDTIRKAKVRTLKNRAVIRETMDGAGGAAMDGAVGAVISRLLQN
jgi:hypothetical protein